MKDDDGCQPLRSICANATEAVPLRMTERVSYRQIYAEHADRYDELVGHEDFEGELPRALKNTIAPAARVVDVGAGTGRVTRLLLEAGVSVVAVEPAAAMLERARENLASWPSDRLALLAGDARELPLDDASVDAAVAGWAFGHFRSWFAPHWRPEVDRALSELERVVRPGGACVVIETLGTGTPTAGAPSPELGEYFEHLGQLGYACHAIRTDYLFPSVDEAARICGFFFGEGLAERIRKQGSPRVVEHTGLWLKKGFVGPAR